MISFFLLSSTMLFEYPQIYNMDTHYISFLKQLYTIRRTHVHSKLTQQHFLLTINKQGISDQHEGPPLFSFLICRIYWQFDYRDQLKFNIQDKMSNMLTIITQSLLGFKQKRTSILEHRNSLLKLLLLMNTINVLILYCFNKIVPTPYMDEQFHYDQYQKYAAGDYTYWNNKLTTPPGFYLIQTLLCWGFVPSLATVRICNCLVFGNLLAIFVMKIYEFQDRNKNNLSRTLALILTPTIYFFNFLDYTDTASLALMAMCYYYNLVRSQYRLFLCSLFAIFTRQNNILWICYLMAHRVITLNSKNLEMPRTFLGHILNFVKIIFQNKLSILRDLKFLIISMVIFVSYIIKYNDSKLVFGDHSNHIPTFHPTQILYLSVFIFLNAPISLNDYRSSFMSTAESIYYSRHSLASYLFLLSICIIVVDNWTMVHPFILADNRHYTFYIYRYFYKKTFFKFLFCLIYPICIIFMVKTMVWSKQKMALLILWFLISFLYLSVSSLVQFRYFSIPFLMYSLQIRNRNLDMDVQRIHLSEGITNKSDRMIWTNIARILCNAGIFGIFLLYDFDEGRGRFMW